MTAHHQSGLLINQLLLSQLNHILNNREGQKVAVIVNNMSDFNIDEALVNRKVELNRGDRFLESGIAKFGNE